MSGPVDLTAAPCEFWCVWTKNGRRPRFTHSTEASAFAEAQRLAAKHPGAKFIVMRAYVKFHAEPAECPTAEEMA